MFRVDHTAVAVTSLARTRAFYESLGARVVSKPSPHFLEMLLGELRLHFILAGNAARPAPGTVGIHHVCLSVETLAELEALCGRLNDSPFLAEYAPFSVTHSPPLGEGYADHCEQRPPRRTLYARDPDGVELEFRAYS